MGGVPSCELVKARCGAYNSVQTVCLHGCYPTPLFESGLPGVSGRNSENGFNFYHTAAECFIAERVHFSDTRNLQWCLTRGSDEIMGKILIVFYAHVTSQ